MKNCIVFLVALGLFISIKGYSQVKPAQAQYFQERGFLVNPGFEQGYKGWDFSGTCTKSLVSEIPYLNKSFKITCVSQTFSLKQIITSSVGMAGQQGVYDLQVKASVDGAKVTQLSGAVRDPGMELYASSTFKRIANIPFVLNTVSNGVEIYSDDPITGEFIIDDIKLGLAPDGFIRQDVDDTPVGTVISYGSTSIPEGYLLADGACKLKSEFSALFAVIGISNGECTVSTANDGFNIPDLRGKFIRGADLAAGNDPDAASRTACSVGGNTGDNVGSCQDDEFESHTHTLSGFASRGFVSGPSVIGSSTANTTYNSGSSGNSETRPKNVYLVYLIKAIGRATKTVVSQKTTSPDKAGFIIWSAFDAEIEGHKKADGSCILKSAYPDYVANVGLTTFGECTISVANDGVLLPDLVSSNRFIRAAGGSLAVGTTQEDDNKAHTHSITFTNNISSGGLAYESGVGSSGSYSTNTSGGAEARPKNMALVPYVRVVNRDEIKGDFAEIKQYDIDLTEETTNDFTFSVQLNNGTVTENNFDFINGNCAMPAPGNSYRYVCNLNTGVGVTGLMYCMAGDQGNTGVNAGLTWEFFGDNTKVTMIPRLATNNSSVGALANGNLEVFCRKQGADFKKSIKAIVVKTADLAVECQTKFLQANTSTLGDIPDLTFNNLEIGKKYEVYGQHSQASNDTILAAIHDGNVLSRSYILGTLGIYPLSPSKFTATSTTLTFNKQSGGSTTGNGTREATWGTLCQLPDNYILNSNKWD